MSSHKFHSHITATDGALTSLKHRSFFLTEAITGYKILHITADITDLKQLLLRHCNLLPFFALLPEHILFLHLILCHSKPTTSRDISDIEKSSHLFTYIFFSKSPYTPNTGTFVESLGTAVHRKWKRKLFFRWFGKTFYCSLWEIFFFSFFPH